MGLRLISNCNTSHSTWMSSRHRACVSKTELIYFQNLILPKIFCIFSFSHLALKPHNHPQIFLFLHGTHISLTRKSYWLYLPNMTRFWPLPTTSAADVLVQNLVCFTLCRPTTSSHSSLVLRLKSELARVILCAGASGGPSSHWDTCQGLDGICPLNLTPLSSPSLPSLTRRPPRNPATHSSSGPLSLLFPLPPSFSPDYQVLPSSVSSPPSQATSSVRLPPNPIYAAPNSTPILEYPVLLSFLGFFSGMHHLPTWYRVSSSHYILSSSAGMYTLPGQRLLSILLINSGCSVTICWIN